MAKKKRGNNEGSITYRKDKKIWEARVTIGYNDNGTQKRKSIYGKTRQEVATKMNTLLNDVQKGIIINSEITVSDWYDEYLSKYKKNIVKKTSYMNYMQWGINYIKPMLGHYKLAELTPHIVQNFINQLIEKELSTGTIHLIFTLLKSSLRNAVNNDMINKNPAAYIKTPEIITKVSNVLEPEQQIRFLEVAKNAKYGDIFILMLCTGMRIGETIALKWDDINFTNEELYVKRTINLVKDLENPNAKWRKEYGTPKTKSSERTIPLQSTAIRLLKEVKSKQEENIKNLGNAYENENLVFPNDLGKLLTQSHMNQRFAAICKKADISGLHPHCFRHTFATRGFENGVEILVMKELLGHKNLQETADLYTHVMANKKINEMRKLEGTVAY